MDKKAKASILLPVLAELISRGDGSYILRPQIPDFNDLDTWLPVAKAAKVLDDMSAKAVYPMLGVFLVYRRPLKSKVLVSLASILELQKATKDPEFWDTPAMQAPLKASVQARMASLISNSQSPRPCL